MMMAPNPLKVQRPEILDGRYFYAPPITITGTEARKPDFFTGDQTGRYLVVVQGLSSIGLAGSRSFVLDVKPAL